MPLASEDEQDGWQNLISEPAFQGMPASHMNGLDHERELRLEPRMTRIETKVV